MSETRVAAVIGALVMVLAGLGWFLGRAATPPTPSDPLASVDTSGAPIGSRANAPVVRGRSLPPTPFEAQAPSPSAWAGHDGGIPTNTWWASLVTGDQGPVTVWPQPLGLRWDEGSVMVSNRGPEPFDGGASITPFVPAVRLTDELADGRQIVDAGPLHLKILTAGGTITLAQGSPLVEIDPTTDTIHLEIPGLDPDVRAFDGGLHVEGAEGIWTIAGAALVAIDGVEVELQPTDDQIVVGPQPVGADVDRWERALVMAARHALVDSDETLGRSVVGDALQTLSWDRGGGDGPITWPRNRTDRPTGAGDPIGTLPSPLGSVDVFVTDELGLRNPAVTTEFTPSPVDDPEALAAAIRADLASPPAPTAGSYWAGKRIWYHALLADLARSIDETELAEEALDEVRTMLSTLADPEREPRLTWNRDWGAAVMVPAEFGSGTELNDHHLQYGYWVGAAAILAEHDPTGADTHREMIDILAAELAGRLAAPADPLARADGLAAERVWSPYHGHGWASGVVPFADGNNLESISESSFAWWATARWRIATGRDDAAADELLARFVVETHRGAERWLPTGQVAGRPWSGVVWAAKSDPNTWFDARPEAALGIRLLPLAPNALARYSTDGAVEAAETRWAWCAGNGGCADLWPELLASDALVAGAPAPPTGAEPESGTGSAVLEWWSQRWG